jgi:hypothetical protein
MYLFDDDLIEEHNLATTIYMQHQLGHQKANALAEMLFRKGVETVIPLTSTVRSFRDITFTMGGGAHLHEDLLVIDTFDNREARMCTGEAGWVNTIHAGVSVERTGAILWHQYWKPPSGEFKRGENPICTRHVGAQIIQLTAAHVARVVRVFLDTGERINVPVILENGRLV